ncbi:MAG: ankyrin repeat domain-containing protein [Candidatus Azobacteroides sp.]|nr:ankyrin repeat domain-containing protein [Candidatus Azobacteroides sp.]
MFWLRRKITVEEKLIKPAVRGDILQLEERLKKSTSREINRKEKGLHYSILAFAVRQVQVESVRLLLKYGADPNSEDRDGKTPLFYAGEPQPVPHDSMEKRLEIAHLLVEAGANVNHADKDHNRPLWTAVFYVRGKEEYLSFVQFLLEKGADPNLVNVAGKSPLMFAEQVGNLPLIELLRQKL